MVHLILLSLLFLHSVTASEKEIEFKPHMVDHINEGCPSGSECSDLYGFKRKKFSDTLDSFSQRKKFIKKSGAPFRFLLNKSKVPNDKNLAIWDSRCFHHRKNIDPILEVEFFTKNTKTLPLPALPKNIYRLRKNKQIDTFPAPLNADITNIKGNKLYFDIRENLSSYGHKVTLEGKISPTKNTGYQKFYRLQCPEELKKAFYKDKSAVYQSYYCSRTPYGEIILTPVTCL